MRDVVTEFQEYNRLFAKRNPDFFRMKVARMAANPFAFFRGTFHLFAHDVLVDKVQGTLPLLSGDGTEMDLVGDIHSENYGTYQAADGNIYYDINDFDETVRGRLDLDVCRLAISLFLVSRSRNDSLADAVHVTLAGLTAYSQTLPKVLKKGKETGISDKNPSCIAPVDQLISAAKDAKRSAFIGRLTEVVNGQRRFVRSQHFFNLAGAEREQAGRLLKDYVTRVPPAAQPDFYNVEDICGRVAGIGSMGRFRYAVLVAGKGTKDARNVIIEFKESRPSAYDLYRQRSIEPEAITHRAEEVAIRQNMLQSATSPYLGYAIDGPISFQAREIGPHDMRIGFADLRGIAAVEQVAQMQAVILAKAHARSVSHAVGLADPLSMMRDADLFAQRVLAFALTYADVVQRDYARFVGHRADIESWQP